jgi:hypothetical protein
MRLLGTLRFGRDDPERRLDLGFDIGEMRADFLARQVSRRTSLRTRLLLGARLLWSDLGRLFAHR